MKQEHFKVSEYQDKSMENNIKCKCSNNKSLHDYSYCCYPTCVITNPDKSKSTFNMLNKKILTYAECLKTNTGIMKGDKIPSSKTGYCINHDDFNSSHKTNSPIDNSPFLASKKHTNWKKGKLNGVSKSSNHKTNVRPKSNSSPKKLTLSLWNAQSVKLKTSIIKEFKKEHDIDIYLIVESWLTPSQHKVIASLKGSESDIKMVPRPNRKGGGICCIHKKTAQY